MSQHPWILFYIFSLLYLRFDEKIWIAEAALFARDTECCLTEQNFACIKGYCTFPNANFASSCQSCVSSNFCSISGSCIPLGQYDGSCCRNSDGDVCMKGICTSSTSNITSVRDDKDCRVCSDQGNICQSNGHCLSPRGTLEGSGSQSNWLIIILVPILITVALFTLYKIWRKKGLPMWENQQLEEKEINEFPPPYSTVSPPSYTSAISNEPFNSRIISGGTNEQTIIESDQIQRPEQRIFNQPLSKRFQKRKPTFLLKIIWVLALLYGEVLIFYLAMLKCRWPLDKKWNTTNYQPYHIALIADPQIIDQFSYGRTGILQWFSEIFPDMYMRKNWKTLQRQLQPDAFFVLGDLMDGGRELKDDEWEAESDRYRKLLRPKDETKTPIHYLAGNHDFGFGSRIIPTAYARFRRFYGKTNYIVTLGNHSIVVIDTVSLSSDNDGLQAEALELIERMRKEERKIPRILMTHIPLYRPPNTDCGPLRQNNRFINQGSGYQYQNLVTESLSNLILDNVKPKLIFSGDDHDYCEVHHSRGEGSIEVTLNSFSFAMGVPKPGFLLLSLHNPLDAESNSTTIGENKTSEKSNLASYTYSQCLLPNQLAIYFAYIYIFFATLFCIILNTWYLSWKTEDNRLPITHKFRKRSRWHPLNQLFWKVVLIQLMTIGFWGLVTFLFSWVWWVV
ncbi:hypothetical protein G9A89_001042 [Geosiphon pyriformis]|nr:hypothetical protein G9A89_001042 [Geosiphon pyriformis]